MVNGKEYLKSIVDGLPVLENPLLDIEFAGGHLEETF